MSEKQVCIACRRPKANQECAICFEPICKDCEQFLEDTTFSFLKEVPEDLSHTHYCPPCYDTTVAPALASYNEILDRARGMYFFFDTQKRHAPILKRSKEKIQVAACVDRDETVLRLAFMAAEQGYNAVIEAVVECEKVRNAGYQKSKWMGIARPATIDVEKFERSAGPLEGIQIDRIEAQ